MLLIKIVGVCPSVISIIWSYLICTKLMQSEWCQREVFHFFAINFIPRLFTTYSKQYSLVSYCLYVSNVKCAFCCSYFIVWIHLQYYPLHVNDGIQDLCCNAFLFMHILCIFNSLNLTLTSFFPFCSSKSFLFLSSPSSSLFPQTVSWIMDQFFTSYCFAFFSILYFCERMSSF